MDTFRELLDKIYELEGLVHLAMRREDSREDFCRLISRKGSEVSEICAKLGYAVSNPLFKFGKSEVKENQGGAAEYVILEEKEESVDNLIPEDRNEEPVTDEIPGDEEELIMNNVPDQTEEQIIDNIPVEEEELMIENVPEEEMHRLNPTAIPEAEESQEEPFTLFENPEEAEDLDFNPEEIFPDQNSYEEIEDDASDSIYNLDLEEYNLDDSSYEYSMESSYNSFEEYSEDTSKELELVEENSSSESTRGKLVFSINERYRFKRELFGNSDLSFNNSLALVASMETYEESEDYFINDIGMNPSDATVIEFLDIIRRYFR